VLSREDARKTAGAQVRDISASRQSSISILLVFFSGRANPK
jgi:hypothetical protein